MKRCEGCFREPLWLPADSAGPFLSQRGPIPEAHGPNDMKDIKDVDEKELTKLYAEYQAGLDRPVPVVVHRQGRRIPGCVSVEDSAAWKSR